uniref:Hypothetical secreted protein n=1 Tax=Simulium nigrimanum TaxID=683695 RepID=D1FPT9_SIMNI
MRNQLVAVTLTLLLALEAGAQNYKSLDVGCCISIETDHYPRNTWTLYDSAKDHWAYLDNKKQSDKSHQWKVKAKQGNIFQFESVAFPGRCLCERTNLIVMYGGTCECRSAEPVQLWQLDGIERSQRVAFKRPNHSYYLYPCKNGLCLIIDPHKFDWIVKPC